MQFKPLEEMDIEIDELFILQGIKRTFDKYKTLLMNSVFVDLGAHVGCASLFAAACGAEKVYAFEPVPPNFTRLERNIKANGYENIIAIEAAISDDGLARQLVSTPDGNSGQYSSYFKRRGDEIYTCRSIAFCDLVRLIGRIDVIKIDIEGAEFEIFYDSAEVSGALDAIGAMFIEIHLPNKQYFETPGAFIAHYPEHDPKDRLMAFLLDCGFSLIEGSENHWFMMRKGEEEHAS